MSVLLLENIFFKKAVILIASISMILIVIPILALEFNIPYIQPIDSKRK